MANTRGNLDTIDQTQVRLLSGGSHATQIVTTDGSAKTTGHLLAWDSNNNAVDSGISTVAIGATPVLDASGNPIFDANGNYIFPG